MQDHIVRQRLSQQDIFQIANAIRQIYTSKRGGALNPVAIILDLCKKILPEKGTLKLIIEDNHDENRPAWVTFRPFALHVSHKVWKDAQTDENFASWAQARWILFHELGHIFLHDHTAKPFTADESLHRKYEKEMRAEWQADTLGMALACEMSERLVKLGAYGISTIYGVPDEIAEDVLDFALTYVPHKGIFSVSKQNCPECQTVMLHTGSHLVCEGCAPPYKVAL